VLYGKDLGSNYQGQLTMLSKHFAEQTAGLAQPAPHGDGGALEDMSPLSSSPRAT